MSWIVTLSESSINVPKAYPFVIKHSLTFNPSAELAHNIHVHDGVSEDGFVKMRTTRDATLSAPTLLLPSIQVNMRAGKLPPADANGVHYLRVPITLPT